MNNPQIKKKEQWFYNKSKGQTLFFDGAQHSKEQKHYLNPNVLISWLLG
jgi:hypothetical protein